MTFAYWCVLVAALLPLIWVGAAKSRLRGYDNNRPRASTGEPGGTAQRAFWAEANALEAFPPFAAGVIIAHLSGGADQGTIDLLAGVFIAFRLLHGGAYLADIGLLRSMAWLGGMVCIIGLFVAAA